MAVVIGGGGSGGGGGWLLIAVVVNVEPGSVLLSFSLLFISLLRQ